MDEKSRVMVRGKSKGLAGYNDSAGISNGCQFMTIVEVVDLDCQSVGQYIEQDYLRTVVKAGLNCRVSTHTNRSNLWWEETAAESFGTITT